MLNEKRRRARGIWAESDIERQQGEGFVDSKRQLRIVANLGKLAKDLHSQLRTAAELIEDTETFEAPEGSAILVEFIRGVHGVDVRGGDLIDEQDNRHIGVPGYEQTDMHWWRQPGVYGAAMPTDSDIRLDDGGSVAFVGKTIEMSKERSTEDYGYPVFFVYNADRSMRVLHGIGHTEISLEPIEEIEAVYDRHPEGVPPELAHAAELLSPRHAS